MEQCLPLALVHKITKQYPDCWNYVEYFREGKTSGELQWDDRCYIPISAGLAIATNGKEMGNYLSDLDYTKAAALIAALAPWRLYKQIYRFAPEMESLLLEQPEDCVLPIEVLDNLPYPSIYIQTQTIESMDGFFAHIESDTNDGRLELRLLLVYKNEDTIQIPIHLGKNGTIQDGIKAARKEALRVQESMGDIAKKRYPINAASDNYVFDVVARLIQLILYICAQNKEIERDPEQEKIVRIPKSPKLIKDKYKEIIKYNCGQETAQIIKGIYKKGKSINFPYFKSDNTEKSKRPHTRRGHWHHYWVGSQDTKKIILKWIAPTLIHPEFKLNDTVKINEIKTDE